MLDIYSRKFRSEPFPLSEVHPCDIPNLISQKKQSLFCANTGTKAPQRGDGEYAWDYFYDIMEDYFYNNPVQITLPDNTMVCDITNYKGEGEGIALFEDVKDLSVFVSKYNYY